jgi:hypothetical protein
VQPGDPIAQHVVGERRTVHCRPDPVRAQGGRLEVEDPFAEATGELGPAVVRHTRGQEGDRCRGGTVRVAVEVVADRAVVDQQQRPRVVGVRGIGVVGEPRVQHFGQPRHARAPGHHVGRAGHVRNVQDPGDAQAAR